MDLLLEAVWFISAYLMGLGLSLSSDVSLVSYVGMGLLHFALICLIIFGRGNLHKKTVIRVLTVRLMKAAADADPRRYH